jgi:leucyl-tRNA synthetase
VKLFSEWKEKFAIILAAFAPHMWEELYSIDSDDSVFFAAWPEYDEKLVIDDEITIWVQVLGKLRGEIRIAKDESKEIVLEKAKAEEGVAKWLEWKELVKEIYVPGRIVNLVVK